MADKQGAAATAASDRIVLLDALRGLALLGILLANTPSFIGWDMLSPEQKAQVGGADVALHFRQFMKFFIDGKFYTIFSLLFGIGFTLQLDRLEKRGAAGAAVFRRRMLVLLAIGMFHLNFIWGGDILSLYAALGLTLPLFRHWPERKLIITALLLLVLPLITVPLFKAWGIDLGAALNRMGVWIMVAIDGQNLSPDIVYMQRTDWHAFAAWQLSSLPFRLAFLLDSWRVPKVLGIMLLGMVAGRRLTAGTLLDDRRLLWRVAIVGLGVGIPFSLAYAGNPDVHQDHWSAVIGTAPMGLAYAALFALAWPRAHAALGIMAQVGRMALTNYLTHSLVGMLVLGPFLNLAGRFGPIEFVSGVLALYALQIVFSRWWLAGHEQGPMEKLWRWGTYGKSPRR